MQESRRCVAFLLLWWLLTQLQGALLQIQIITHLQIEPTNVFTRICHLYICNDLSRTLI